MVFEDITDAQRAEMLTTYAALVLHDGKVEITESSLLKVIEAAGATVEPVWPKLFADMLKGKDITDLIMNSGSAGAPAAPAAAGAASGAAPAAAAAEEKKEPEEDSDEEEDGDMGFSLFD